MSIFLSAQWKHLALFNYAVERRLLEPFLPVGCELDLYEGKAYLSLVAFEFRETRVLGVAWPGFTNFPEINLRFYVHHQGQRGVCFIREFVPSRLVAGLARLIYNEPYLAASMSSSVRFEEDIVRANYGLGQDLQISVTARDTPILPAETSLEHFFKEHDTGYGKDRHGQRLFYKVHHPHWRTYPMIEAQLSIDWEKVYGPRFAFLEGQKPNSVVLAEGSEIQVIWRNSNAMKNSQK